MLTNESEATLSFDVYVHIVYSCAYLHVHSMCRALEEINARARQEQQRVGELLAIECCSADGGDRNLTKIVMILRFVMVIA